jgi:hypothetical protein
MESASKMTPCDTSVGHIDKIHITMLQILLATWNTNLKQQNVLSIGRAHNSIFEWHSGISSKKGSPLCGPSLCLAA